MIVDVSFRFVPLKSPGAHHQRPVPGLGVHKPPLTSAIEAERSVRNRILARMAERPHWGSKSLFCFAEQFPHLSQYTLYLLKGHVFKCLQFCRYHVVSESIKSPNPDHLISRYSFCKWLESLWCLVAQNSFLTSLALPAQIRQIKIFNQHQALQ